MFSWMRPVLAGGLALTLMTTGAVGAQVPTGDDAFRPPAVAVVPLANYSGRSEGSDVVMPLVYEHLRELDIPFLPDSALRPLLRRFRLRSPGSVAMEGARTIGMETGAARLLLGSIDIFEPGLNPEVAISLRVLNIRTGKVARATSEAAAGEDYAGLFGVGRVEDVEEVARRVVFDAIDELGHPLAMLPGPRSGENAIRVAVVDFDNSSSYSYAGEVVSRSLLSQLVQAGYDVVEPRAIDDVFIRAERVVRGEIDYALVDSLRTHFDIDLVVTGTVSEMEMLRGSTASSNPRVGIDARVLDALTGQVLVAFTKDKSGSDSESIFELGRYHSLGRLVNAVVGDLMKKIDEGRRKYLAVHDY